MTRHIEIYPVRVIFIILTISCMVVIFMFSRDNAGKSSKKSGRVTEAAVETVQVQEIPEEAAQEIVTAAMETVVTETVSAAETETAESSEQ